MDAGLITDGFHTINAIYSKAIYRAAENKLELSKPD